jgi:hypothetical protein
MLYKSLRTGVLLGNFPNLFESICCLKRTPLRACNFPSTARHLRQILPRLDPIEPTLLATTKETGLYVRVFET